MSRLSLWRISLFAVVCLIAALGVRVAHNSGHAALGPVGGLLVAVVAVLLIGATVFLIGVFLFGERQ